MRTVRRGLSLGSNVLPKDWGKSLDERDPSPVKRASEGAILSTIADATDSEADSSRPASRVGSMAGTPSRLRRGETGFLKRPGLLNKDMLDLHSSDSPTNSHRDSLREGSFNDRGSTSEMKSVWSGGSDASTIAPAQGLSMGRRRSISGGGGYRGRRHSSGRVSRSLLAKPPEEPKRGKGVENVLQDVMRAYMNLELSGVDDKQMEGLARALQANQSVTTINLSYNTSISEEGIRVLANGLRVNVSVCSLNLSGCTGVTDKSGASLLEVLDQHPNLSTLQLSGCASVGDATVKRIASSLHNKEGSLRLVIVNLSGCREVTDEGACALGKALENSLTLETLQLQGCTKITDRGVVALAEGLGASPPLQLLDLSWCEEVTDVGVCALAANLAENRFLQTLQLSCCVGTGDEGAKAIAAALEKNSSLTTLDLSWIVRIGDSALGALTQAMIKNRSLTTLHLSGCKCTMPLPHSASPAKIAALKSKDGMTGHLAELASLLQRNRRRPKSLAASALGNLAASGISGRRRSTPDSGPHQFGRRASNLTTPGEVGRMLKATILNGAALYNADDSDGCFKLFKSTAESVIAATRSPVVNEALKRATGSNAPPTMQQRLWLLRCAFDTVLDELAEKEENGAAENGHAAKGE